MAGDLRPRPIPLAGVAAQLGRSLPWLHRHIRRLREEHGFPKPLPLIGLYDPLAIDAWMARQTGDQVKQQVPAEPEAPAADDWAAILDARAKQLAPARKAA